MTGSLENILSKLGSDEARAAATLNLTKGKIATKDQIEKAIETYERMGKHDFAAYVAERAGLYERAREIYAKGSNICHTALDRTVQESGASGIIIYLAKQLGLTGKIINFYENLGKVDLIAYTAAKYGLNEKAIEFYEKLGNPYVAMNIASKAGLTKRLIGLYERVGDLDSAAYVAEKKGMDSKALDLYERCGDFNSALRLSKKLGLPEKTKAYEDLISLSTGKKE